MNLRTVRRKAKAWMVEHEIRNVDIERALGMNNHVMVSQVLSGKKNHRRILSYLIDRGCPREYLELPTDVEVAA